MFEIVFVYFISFGVDGVWVKVRVIVKFSIIVRKIVNNRKEIWKWSVFVF